MVNLPGAILCLIYRDTQIRLRRRETSEGSAPGGWSEALASTCYIDPSVRRATFPCPPKPLLTIVVRLGKLDLDRPIVVILRRQRSLMRGTEPDHFGGFGDTCELADCFQALWPQPEGVCLMRSGGNR
jgi:hypothetical protein